MGLQEIGGILYYHSRGHGKPCGQTVGADGSGEYMVIFMGPPEQAEMAARVYIRGLEGQGHKFTTVSFVPNEKTYADDAISIIAA